MKNVLLTIAYDGTDFCGWQKQPGQRSVQGEVERVLGMVCAQPIKLNGTSRTDAGVHAFGQRASFTGEFGIPVERIPVVANGMFASAASEKSRKASGDVAILAAEEAPENFHARFNAVGKKYIYKINNAQTPDPFQRNFSYQVVKPLNVEAMKEAAEYLRGTLDYKCFQAAGGKEMETTVRTIFGTRISMSGVSAAGAAVSKDQSSSIEFEIIGDGFLYNMVRIITGTLVDVGLGKKKPQELPEIIGSRDRRLAGHTAPPQGLYLAEVYYEEKALHMAADALYGRR